MSGRHVRTAVSFKKNSQVPVSRAPEVRINVVSRINEFLFLGKKG